MYIRGCTSSQDIARICSASPISKLDPYHQAPGLKDVDGGDDGALAAHSASDMQLLLDNFTRAASLFSLKVNIKKTVYTNQSNFFALLKPMTSSSTKNHWLKPYTSFTLEAWYITVLGWKRSSKQGLGKPVLPLASFSRDWKKACFSQGEV